MKFFTKRYFLTSLLIFFSCFAVAQQHLIYLGVPMDGNRTKMFAEWKKKGMTINNDGYFRGKFNGWAYDFQINDDLSKFTITFAPDSDADKCLHLLGDFIHERMFYAGMPHIKETTRMNPYTDEDFDNQCESCLYTNARVENNERQFIGEIVTKIIYPHKQRKSFIVQVIYYDVSYKRNDPSFPYSLDASNRKWYDITKLLPFCKKASLSAYADSGISGYYFRLQIASQANNSKELIFAVEGNDKNYLDQLFSNNVVPEVSKELLAEYVRYIIKVSPVSNKLQYSYRDSFKPMFDAYCKVLKQKEDALLAKKQRGRKIFEMLFGNYFTKHEYDLIDKYLPSIYMGTIFKSNGSGQSNNSNDFIKQAELATKQELNIH